MKASTLLKRLLAGLVVAVLVIGGAKAWFWLSDNKLGNVRTETELFVELDDESAMIQVVVVGNEFLEMYRFFEAAAKKVRK